MVMRRPVLATEGVAQSPRSEPFAPSAGTATRGLLPSFEPLLYNIGSKLCSEQRVITRARFEWGNLNQE
jgi:hypothetical protein